MHAAHPVSPRHAHATERAKERASGAPGRDQAATLQLLLPVKRVGDIVYGARYARRLREWGIDVHVHLLHVMPPLAQHADGTVRHGQLDNGEAAAQLMREAGLYLSRSDLPFSTHIFSGERLFIILDTAELLGCQEIVLPALKSRSWQRHFADTLAHKLARATRSAIVLLADADGIGGPPAA